MRTMVKTLRGRETTGCVDPTEINFRRDILTQTVFQVLTGSFQSGFRGKPCDEEGRRERVRKSITNDTTQRYVDDVVRKCVEVKTSQGHCTTGFGDLVEINFTPPASQQRLEHVGVAEALVDPVCEGEKPQYSKYLVIHEGWARDGMKSARKHGLSSKRKSTMGQWAPRHQTDNSSGSFWDSKVRDLGSSPLSWMLI